MDSDSGDQSEGELSPVIKALSWDMCPSLRSIPGEMTQRSLIYQRNDIQQTARIKCRPSVRALTGSHHTNYSDKTVYQNQNLPCFQS
ncbi:hypothetical protein E1301_Tti017613 [Triplophysa tibetana]|uniref:Uncharacterized protein n=1 Tax=Triplophysa tibetana TaxID=1572043 RepID=A0A5A9P1G5_9TELE|nr:hypothetical protein E1301_Tti017613 [Triplophysa tibetana]